MKLTAMVLAACLASGAASAAGVTRMVPTAPEDAGQLAAIKEASTRGLIMYDLHRAREVADAAMKKALKPDRQAAIAAAIVEPGAAGDLVTYYGLRTSAPYPIFTATVAAGKVTAAQEVPAGGSASLTQAELRMIAARQAAGDTGLSSCTKAPFEIIVFPPLAPDRLDVYLLTPKPNPSVYPLGGHYRLSIDTTAR